MAGTMTFPALLPGFLEIWGLDNAAAGWINGIAQAGYVLAVPVLVTLTDRVDPRHIYLVSMLLSAVATAGFALFAQGFWTAMLFTALGGVGLAGTYMPGLRILSDHIGGAGQSRYLSFYTASFALGSSLSVLMAGVIADRLGWRAAFASAAIGAVLALALAAWTVPRRPPGAGDGSASLLDFRPVLRNRPAMGYILAYAAHCWELFGFRTWLVAFLAFSAARTASDGTAGDGAAGSVPAEVTALATIVILLGLPSSILGNEAAIRFGRRRVVSAIMLASALLAAGIGFASGLPFWAVATLVALYGITVTADSASLTVGAVTAAVAGRQGATLAVHSFIGFSAAFLAPVVFGAVLDAAGGNTRAAAWGWAFASLGIVVALGPLALALAASGTPGRALARRLGILVAGWSFVLLGIAGMFLPFLQGILFLLIGLSILSHEYRWARRLVDRIRARFPRAAGALDEAQAKAKARLDRFLGR